MPDLYFILKSVSKGKTLVRTLLEYRLLQEKLAGEVMDLGSGGTDQYTKFIPREKETHISFFDQKMGQETDFEKDRLPLGDNRYDIVLFLNVLEHIFNHRHILREIHRIKKNEGVLVGFVPFLKWYHQDPHDFFRYTHESLELLLNEADYKNINVEPLYLGPYATAFDMILPTLPKLFRPLFYIPCHFLDKLFRKLRPNSAERYVLGYYFVAK